MQENPVALLCGLFCIFPLIFFGLPGFMIGRFWGRAKLRSPIVVNRPAPLNTPNVQRRPAPERPDPAGFGAPRQ